MKIEYTFAFRNDNLMACQPLIKDQCALMALGKYSALCCSLFIRLSVSRRFLRYTSVHFHIWSL